jgi:hypothetical protein
MERLCPSIENLHMLRLPRVFGLRGEEITNRLLDEGRARPIVARQGVDLADQLG